MEILSDEHRLSIAEPRVPAWAVNTGIVLLIAALWPLSGLVHDRMDPYFLRIVILIGMNIILATSLNLINGITGQFSLGHAGFMALGAYTTGPLLLHFGSGGPPNPALFLAAVIAGGLVASTAGLLVGIPTLRLRGDYLAIATLGFNEIIYTLILNTEKIGPLEIGGASGLHGVPITTNFFWTFFWVVICVVCVWRLAYSTKGMAFRALREDEIASTAMGIDTTYYKVAAFVIGAFFAGICGGLWATLDGNLHPTGFRFMKSIEIVVIVVLGGSGSVTGAILAAAVLTYLPEQLRFFQDWRMIIYSLVLIFMMLLRPSGLLGSRELWWSRRRLNPARVAAPANAPPADPAA